MAISTFGTSGAGRDYDTLAGWEAATDNDLVTAAEGEILECYDDLSSYDMQDVFDGATTNATYYREIRPHSSVTWDPTNNTDGIIFEYTGTSGSGVFDIREAYFRLSRVKIRYNGSGAWPAAGIKADTGCTYVTLKDLVVFNCTTSDAHNCYGVDTGGTGNVVVNLLSYGNENYGLIVGTGTTAYNCILAHNATIGIFDSSSTSIYNVLSAFNTTADFETTGWTNSDYCMSTDGSEPTGTGNAESTQTVAQLFTDYANGDYSIVGTSSDQYQAGNNYSSTTGVSEDITGDTTWGTGTDASVGAFEFASAGGSIIPQATHHYRANSR